MPEKTKKQTIYYLENINLLILSGFLLFLPIFFLSTTTDAFILPKQIILAIAVSVTGIIFGIKTLIEGKIRLRLTPLDLPVVLLAIFSFASSIFAVNRVDAIIAFIPFFFAILLFFITTNTVKHAHQLLVLLGGLVIGTCLSSLLAIASYFQIYLLPFPYTRVTYFNTFGSLLDQAVFFGLLLPFTGYFVHSIFKNVQSKRKTLSVFAEDQKIYDEKITPISLLFSIAFFIILAGLSVTVYQLATTQPPLILPLETGFQTGFSSISQDSGRVLWGFLFGSGYGTYLTDFTRFKPLSYNLDQNLWSFTFFRSSTFILELLATTGVLGLFAFLFLIFKIIKERGFLLPLILAIIASFILPFSSTLVTIFFVLLGLFAIIHSHNNPHKFNDVELYFVALKRGLLSAKMEDESVRQNASERRYSKLLPILFLVVLIVLIGLPLYFSIRLFISDLLYQRSLAAYSQNDGEQAYRLQLSSINVFPRDIYYRGFSQTNIALANALAQQTQSESASPSSQNQQYVLQLIQDAITAGRNAAIISPQTSFNWNNLSSIYRNLIGFGENADRFAILTNQQAIALDPKNPLQYIDLGGIYYQLGMYDEAISQFQIAISLKKDYANAYYNLGHALEMKGNLTEALAAYQIVRSIVGKEEANNKKITDEITALEAKITQEATAPQEQAGVAEPNEDDNQEEQSDEELRVNTPSTTLPERDPKVEISGPPVSPSVSPKPSGGASPAPSGASPTTSKKSITPDL